MSWSGAGAVLERLGDLVGRQGVRGTGRLLDLVGMQGVRGTGRLLDLVGRLGMRGTGRLLDLVGRQGVRGACWISQAGRGCAGQAAHWIS